MKAWIEVVVHFLEVEVDQFLVVSLGDKLDWWWGSVVVELGHYLVLAAVVH